MQFGHAAGVVLVLVLVAIGHLPMQNVEAIGSGFYDPAIYSVALAVAITLSLASLGLVAYRKISKMRTVEGWQRSFVRSTVFIAIAVLPSIYGLYFMVGPIFYSSERINPPFPFYTGYRYYDTISSYYYSETDNFTAIDAAVDDPNWLASSASLYFGIAATAWLVFRNIDRRTSRTKKPINNRR